MANTSQGKWTVPPEWRGERCFIICGGASVANQLDHVRQLRGRIIAIKQSVALRPDADVMFIAGKDDGRVCKPFFGMFHGKHLVARGSYPQVPPRVKVLERDVVNPNRLSHAPTHLAGLDAGTSAINLAYLFGALEIVLLGYDMTGGRWLNGRYPHHMPYPPQEHFDRHLASLPRFADDLREAGVRVVNVSPISAVTVFERRLLGEYV